MSGLNAGTAVAAITPPVGTPMDGYGARRERSRGVHDPLYARALVLSDGGTTAAVVACDLLGIGGAVASWAREAVERAAGIPGDHVMIACTHTHAGPFGLRAPAARVDADLGRITARAIAGAVAMAARSVRPVQARVATAQVASVSQNRRDPDWPIDPVLKVLTLQTPAGEPVAALLNYACHATVLDHTNLLYSADYPGAAVRAVERAWPGVTALYLNGACADVNPVWLQQDFDEVERIGGIVGAQAARLALEMRALGRPQRAHNIRWDELTEKPATIGRILRDVRLRPVTRRVTLPLRRWEPRESYDRRIAELEAAAAAAGGAAARRSIMAQVTQLRMERYVPAIHGYESGGTRETEVQALGLAPDFAILGLPGEFFVETARAVEEAAGMADLFVSCYTNDYVGYVAPPQAYPQGGYEPGAAPFPPEVEPRLRDLAAEAVREAVHAAPQPS